ncbi:MAG: ABC transporter substrate-binding protein [Anaerolineaceae bacterium]|nr:ABC transporter substrate-binding protein [Anaerolineaceae bacterium]
MNKRTILTLLMVVAVALLAFAPLQAQDDAVLNVAWPYTVPPTGHFNTFATNGLVLGQYQDLHEPPLAILHWATGEYEGMLASEFGWDDDGNYVVTLVDGVTWSDGSAMTADDLMATFNIFRLRGDAVWASMTGIEKVDDMTVKFIMDAPSSLAERLILITNLRPASVYGELADRAAMLEPGDEWDALLSELTEFRPETPVSGGPYTIVPDSITEANLMMDLNPGGFGADVQNFSSVRVWNGETEVVTPLVANEELWYITHGIPPTTEEAFSSQGIDIVRSGMVNGPGLYLNHAVAPFDMVEVRQAIAYAIDREQNGFVSLGESGVAVEYMTGLADGLTESWLSDEALDSLNIYEYDLDKAAELMESAGYTLNDDGKWVDADGNTLSFELTFPQEYADWSAAAENATAQLNDFGFDITARGVQFQQHPQDIYDGNFEMAIRNWGLGDPIPARSFLEAYNRYNGQGELAGEAGSPGIGFDVNVTYSGGDLNVFEVANESAQGVDRDAQAELVTELAVSYNELLPAIPLWERYTNNALNRNYLSLPEDSDPIYANFGGGADNWMTYLILTGQVAPAS